MQANMHEAKSKLSQLVESALKGEEVVIAKSGKPAVRLVPCKPNQKREFGTFKGQIEISDAFDSYETSDTMAKEFGIL
jgi:prevent-host-death family protein